MRKRVRVIGLDRYAKGGGPLCRPPRGNARDGRRRRHADYCPDLRGRTASLAVLVS
jgi:hypothetical protein